MPSFYDNIQSLIGCGTNPKMAFAINRVEIPGHFTLHSMEDMYKTVMLYKQQHPGFDCFVIPREWLPAIAAKVGDVYLGYPPIGQHLKIGRASCRERVCQYV